MQESQLAIQIVSAIARHVLDHGSYIVEHAVSFLGNLLLMIFAFFFMLRDQEELQRGIFKLLPFTRGHEDEIRQRIVTISRSSLLGIFLTAIAQGLGAAVAFWITGIPVLFGAAATALASFIPLIGTGVIWLPATLYLLLTHKIGSAIFLSIWWAVVVVFVLDNLLRPFLMSGRTEMSTPLVFFFILGGIHFFGLAGVLYGPLILGALYILLYLYDLTISGSPTLTLKEN
jgi:predicted PurR-regulated permease PerM